MPELKWLTKEEKKALGKRGQPKDDTLQPYIDFLKTVPPVEEGDEGDEDNEEDWAKLGYDPTKLNDQGKPDETSRSVKRRLTTAAKQLGKVIKYRQGSDNPIKFRVVALSKDEKPEAASTGKGGRKKKDQPAAEVSTEAQAPAEQENTAE